MLYTACVHAGVGGKSEHLPASRRGTRVVANGNRAGPAPRRCRGVGYRQGKWHRDDTTPFFSRERGKGEKFPVERESPASRDAGAQNPTRCKGKSRRLGRRGNVARLIPSRKRRGRQMILAFGSRLVRGGQNSAYVPGASKPGSGSLLIKNPSARGGFLISVFSGSSAAGMSRAGRPQEGCRRRSAAPCPLRCRGPEAAAANPPGPSAACFFLSRCAMALLGR